MTQPNEGQEGKFVIQENLDLRVYACIHLKVPRTGKPWLDALITESLRNEMAGRALTGMLSNSGLIDVLPISNSGINTYKLEKASYVWADAMLQSGKGEE